MFSKQYNFSFSLKRIDSVVSKDAAAEKKRKKKKKKKKKKRASKSNDWFWTVPEHDAEVD